MTWLAAVLMCFGVAFASALVPLINIEAVVLVLMVREPHLSWIAIAAAVASGQLLGKLPYFLAARGSIHLPEFLHRRMHPERPPSERRERWKLRTKKLRAMIHTVRERCHEHPYWMNGTYGVSAVAGIPPYMAMVVLAGLGEMRMPVFVSVGLLGRFVRFGILAASPAMFLAWFT